MVRQREITRREQLAVDKQLFEQRTNLRQVKRNLPGPYKEGDDDILINQKVRITSQILKRAAILTVRAAEEEALGQSTCTWWSA